MVKIDIISGYLGSGKTTFGNMLLDYYINLGLKPVYIVNEFGQTGLDARIIEASGFRAVEMPNGCVCCSLKNDIPLTIKKVIKTFSPTNIVFEPSGIFVFENFVEIIKSDMLKNECEIGNVFTIVDSVNFKTSKAAYGSFIYNQIKNAPVIILSKLEKTKNSVEELICDIKNINPYAFIMSKTWVEWTAADFENVLGQQKYLHNSSHIHSHIKLRSFTVKLENLFTKDKIDRFVTFCQSDVFGDLCRVKGIIMTETYPVLLNIAMQDVVIDRFNGISEQTLTFIGQTINEKEILEFL